MKVGAADRANRARATIFSRTYTIEIFSGCGLVRFFGAENRTQEVDPVIVGQKVAVVRLDHLFRGPNPR